MRWKGQHVEERKPITEFVLLKMSTSKEHEK